MPINEAGIHHLVSWDGDVGRSVLERIATFEDAARLNAPVRIDHVGEHLNETIDHAIQPDEPGKLVAFIGTHPDEDVRGYSWIVQEGSQPHVIAPRPPTKRLKFKVAGRTIYATKVNHPGTQPDPFLMRWIGLLVD